MLNEVEIQRFEKIEKELTKLRSEIEMQQIVISGLLKRLFADDAVNHPAFFSALRDELSKLPPESDTRHNHIHKIQQWVDRYKN